MQKKSKAMVGEAFTRMKQSQNKLALMKPVLGGKAPSLGTSLMKGSDTINTSKKTMMSSTSLKPVTASKKKSAPLKARPATARKPLVNRSSPSKVGTASSSALKQLQMIRNDINTKHKNLGVV